MSESLMAPSSPSPTSPAAAPADPQELEGAVVAALKTVFDPEIPVDIYELGLIYDLDISPEGAVMIKMTLTSPAGGIVSNISVYVLPSSRTWIVMR